MTDNRYADELDRLAAEPLDAADAAVLAALRDIHAGLDPVPAKLTDEVKFALTVAALNAEVAELQRLGAGLGAGLGAEGALTRSMEYTRTATLSFSGGGFTAMITVDANDDDVRVDGWLDGGAARVELRERERTRTQDVGEDGRFVFERVQHGLVQIVLHPLDETRKPVITPSFDV